MQKKYSTTKNSIASDYCGNQCRGVTYCYSAKTRRLKFCAEMAKPSSMCEKVKIVKYKVHVELFKPLVLDEHDRVLHTLKLRNPQGSTN